jgi:hypothetical protein
VDAACWVPCWPLGDFTVIFNQCSVNFMMIIIGGPLPTRIKGNKDYDLAAWPSERFTERQANTLEAHQTCGSVLL